MSWLANAMARIASIIAETLESGEKIGAKPVSAKGAREPDASCQTSRSTAISTETKIGRW